jgi:hypothetical protein
MNEANTLAENLLQKHREISTVNDQALRNHDLDTLISTTDELRRITRIFDKAIERCQRRASKWNVFFAQVDDNSNHQIAA